MYYFLPIAEIEINILIILFSGFFVGFLSGLFGVGGGFLMTPILIFLGIPPATAVATESTQILGSSVSGASLAGRIGTPPGQQSPGRTGAHCIDFACEPRHWPHHR